MNWKKGDIAICIQPKGTGLDPIHLKPNGEYLVSDVLVCQCGIVGLDIGFPTVENAAACDCLRIHKTKGVFWFYSKRFIKKDPRSIEERISDAVEKEEYELAHELTQLQRSI